MLSNTGKKKLLSFVIALTLVLGNFTFAAKPKIQLKSLKEESKNILEDKIHEDVRKSLDKDGSAEVLVYMKDRVNPQKVAELNAKGKTPYEQKLSARKALVSSLVDKAETTQYDLIKFLEQEKEEGKVSEFQSFHIVNMVYLKGDKETIENIAYMEEVEMIYPNRKVDLIKPEKSEPVKTLEATEGLEWNIERVGANQAWELGYDGTGAVVGMIDTGADWTHEALKEKWRGYNPADPDNPNPEGNWFDAVNGRSMPYDIPSSPHGSHVMGTILGQDPEGSNKIGVAPGARWIAAKAFETSGGYDHWLIAAGEWMLAPGGDITLAPDVVNNSWSGGSGRDDWYMDMVDSWRAAGIVPVFAAGNYRGSGNPPPGSIASPGNYPQSFAVGATDRNNIRAYFSLLGPGPYNDDIKPEIVAPGVGIRSSVPGGYEGGWNGTSMATPHITGAVALLRSANSSLTVDEIEDILTETAAPLTDDDYPEAPNYGYGHGLLNVFDAISEIATGTGTIKGKVLIDGEDIEDPEIEHTPITEDCFIGSDIPIEARITDDVSIVEAELMVQTTGVNHWAHIPMNRTSGDVKDGIYEATIPAELIKVPGFKYKIKVRDYDGNIVYSDEYNVEVKFGILPGEYETDFENYPIGWILDGDWQWGEPVGEPTPYRGSKLIGTVLDGNYSNSSDSLLITPPIDLRDENLPSASLRLFHWYETENRYDKGQIYITNDYGENWIPVGPEHTGNKKQWDGLFIDLNEYIGSENPVFVGFRLTSDVSVNRLGWYIDDITLVGEDTEAPSSPTSLTGEVKVVGTTLEWEPSPEIDVEGYKVYRSETPGGEYTLLGDTKTNKYFDTTVESETTYYYVVTAYDFAGNESEYSEELELTVGTIDLIYSSNFEEDAGGFTADGNNITWEWGVPTSGPGSALSGEKVWGTILDGKYLNNSNSWIESEEISLPAEGNSILYFNHWYQTESPRYDKCQVHVAGEDGIWTNITPDESFGGRIEEWTETELSLDEYQGENIKIRFVFISDYSLNYDGWYIDSVIVANLQEGQEGRKIDMPTVIKEDYTLEELEKEGKLKEGYKKPKALDYKIKTETKSKAIDYKKVEEESIDVKLSAIPVDATVTILETGRSVRTNLATGTYEIRHAANEPGETWTLRATAYGYYPKEVKVALDDGEVIRQNFSLDPMPRGNIVGTVVDRYSKDVVPNAHIRVVEDTNVEPVYSDENGNFIIPDVLEGKYTLKIVADGYEQGEIEVDVTGNQDNRADIGLKRFVGYEEEIIYDDGSAENALVLNTANNGLAIRVTPAQYGKVKGANIYFWNHDWPVPGGEEIGIAIFDTDGKGNPTEMVGEPKIVTVNRGEWNYIDLSDFGFSTDKDFFIATVQNKIGDQSPGVGIDESTPHADRSYLHLGGEEFVPLSGEGVQGGLMIRGIMEYSLDTPLITNLDEINFTNKDSIKIEGQVTSDSIVNVYINGDRVAELESEDRKFTGEIVLPAEENNITVSATLEGKETEPSAPIMVIKDKEAPELNISSPEEGEKINKEVVTVKGNVRDANLDKVLVNEEKVEVNENGDFSKKIILDNGENIITIVAKDLAGNETTVERKVYVGLEGPTITDIMPNEDLVVKPGEEVTISFRSESTGGKAYFEILLPLNMTNNNSTKIEMEEVEPGYYVATWTVPENMELKDGIIRIEFTDGFGNTIREEAPGKLTIETEPGKEVELPELTNINPDKDQVIRTGNKLRVSFRSERGGTAYFTIKHPDGDIEVDMKEGWLFKGRYTGEWRVPDGITGEDLIIEITFINKDGLEVKELTPGKLTIKPKSNSWWFW